MAMNFEKIVLEETALGTFVFWRQPDVWADPAVPGNSPRYVRHHQRVPSGVSRFLLYPWRIIRRIDESGGMGWQEVQEQRGRHDNAKQSGSSIAVTCIGKAHLFHQNEKEP